MLVEFKPTSDESRGNTAVMKEVPTATWNPRYQSASLVILVAYGALVLVSQVGLGFGFNYYGMLEIVYPDRLVYDRSLHGQCRC